MGANGCERMNGMREIEWAHSPGLVAYEPAQAFMQTRAQAIAEGRAGECVWLLEHPPLYTAGLSAQPSDLLNPQRFPIHRSERGGQYTYHGPGQRVAYVLLNLAMHGRDVRAFVCRLERWLIAALADLGVEAFTRAGRVGVWVIDRDGKEAKIAALGVRIRRWVSYHGIALNVAPNLSHFSGIVPCGIREFGVTSLAALGIEASMHDVDAALKRQFEASFGCKTMPVPAPIPGGHADAHGDFFYDELMTAQPDAAQEFFRRQLAEAMRAQ